MTKIPFRKLVFLIAFFFIHGQNFSQRWVPEDDFNHIKTFDNVLDQTISSLSLIKPSVENGKKYFTNSQYDEIERLYFRYTLCTKSLLDIVNAYKDISNKSKFKKNNAQAFALGYCASLTLYKHSAELVLKTASNQPLINKLNEEFPRAEIKKDGLNYLISNLTNPKNVNNIDIANEFFKRQINRRKEVYKETDYFPFIDELIARTENLSKEYDNYKKLILDSYTILPLEAAEIMQVNTIEETVNTMVDEAGSQLKAIQEFLFTIMADVRMPLVEGIKFSRRQKKQVTKALKPGDIILTYSSGYLSNIFLPGYFKHALSFTGSQNIKKNAMLSEVRLKESQKKYIGENHNIIEANSDGVRTSTLESYLNGYANRIIAFRPNLKDSEIRIALKNLYSFLGHDYDFDFDLTSGEKQACSEIVYRSYNGIGNIKLELEVVLGATTLSGDKLLQYFINDKESKLIFLAVENPTKPTKAKLYEGIEAVQYIKANAPGVVKN
ncbi:YiiX/YebB-like N1pC/P60 family cysteine hydrolase [Candidatus Marinimicrobia bacterium]|nr:YiiX/YebB-like N1pC/P60 family cysteine hydrolase [Candidatus Neomarinimicrobiota bacterium]